MPAACNAEITVRDCLASKLNGQVEVSTPVGSIDILTSSEVIEVKKVNLWKTALGQVLAYSNYYPEHNKRIHLFGKARPEYIELAKQHCYVYGVEVSYEDFAVSSSGKTALLIWRVSASEKARYKELAKNHDKSLSEMVRLYLEIECAKEGI